jgi:hypothetical protein
VTHTTTELSVMSTKTEIAPSASGYEAVRFNAMKHGILSRYTVLSHENDADYESLVNSLMAEHLPAGATEQHLVEELASIIWRKRRVLQAEVPPLTKDSRLHPGMPQRSFRPPFHLNWVFPAKEPAFRT